MKVTKTSTQPTFQPIELTITIESKEELENFNGLCARAGDVRETLYDYECLDYDGRKMLEHLLNLIGEAL